MINSHEFVTSTELTTSKYKLHDRYICYFEFKLIYDLCNLMHLLVHNFRYVETKAMR